VVVAVAVASLVAIWGVTSWATAPAWVPFLPGLSIDAIAEVASKLDDAAIPYRLELGGSEIQVAEANLARARVLVAREGLPARGRPGFELFDKPSWGMTDFTQRINYRRALEGELERTITNMRGVDGAQVHLAIAESNAFRKANNPEAASVVLKLRSGARPGAELVDGITSLIASSVDGLDSDKVTVLDDSGHLLSAAVEPGVADGLTKRQLALRRDVEGYLETKAEELVAQVVGSGNARVRVAADINFDRLDRTTQTVDPEMQVTTHEEKSEIVPGAGQTGAGTSATSASYEASRKIETFSAATGGVRRLSVAVLVNERAPADGATPVQPRTPAELRQVESLVRNAVGLDSIRGDAITVVSVPFDLMSPEVISAPVEAPTIWQRLQQLQRLIVGALALLLAFVVAMQALKALRLPKIELPVSSQFSLDAGEPELALSPAKAAALAEAGRQSRLLSQSAERPEVAARVLRAWMKES
jgi:flagellar M-ring protein FliF